MNNRQRLNTLGFNSGDFDEDVRAVTEALQTAAQARDDWRARLDLNEQMRLRDNAYLLKQRDEARAVDRAFRESVATHRCTVCNARWQLHSPTSPPASWSLASEKCGPCCDNVPMGPQLEPLGLYAAYLSEERRAERFMKMAAEFELEMRAATRLIGEFKPEVLARMAVVQDYLRNGGPLPGEVSP